MPKGKALALALSAVLALQTAAAFCPRAEAPTMPCCDSSSGCAAGMLVAPCCAGQPDQAADPSPALETAIAKRPLRNGTASVPCEPTLDDPSGIAELIRTSRASHVPGRIDRVPLYILNASILR